MSPFVPTTRPATTIPPTVVLLQMCHNLQEVTQLHAQLIVSGLINRRPNASRLVHSYVSVSQINRALSVFEAKARPDVYAYNTIMRGLILDNRPSRSLLMYNKLLLDGLAPNSYSYTFALKACSRLSAVSEGKQVHCQVIKAGTALDTQTHVHSSLIHMYANSGHIDSAERVLAEFPEESTLVKNSMMSGYLIQGQVQNARSVFDDMATKDVASWSAMVSGYVKNGMYRDALEIFRDMVSSRVPPNESTLVSALSASSHLGAHDSGLWIHKYIDKTCLAMSNSQATALIDMYSKCGSIDKAYILFKKMPRRDVITWGAMISGFAINGNPEKCFQLLQSMVLNGFSPNKVIFVSILSACAHAGLVEKGKHYFNKMIHEFGISPSIEHYGCIVDMLGRAGMVEEAEHVINSMSEEPNSAIWGALLSACRRCNDVERGKRALRKLDELGDAMIGDWYKLAGIMYESAGRKEDARRVRECIREKGMEMTQGWSWIEVEGRVYEFVVGNMDHVKAEEIYEMTHDINRSIVLENSYLRATPI